MALLDDVNLSDRSTLATPGSLQDTSEAGKERLWDAILADIEKRVGHQRYGIWFKQTELMGLDGSGLAIGVPNVIIKQYLDQQYKATVCQAVEQVLGFAIEVRFDVAPSLLREARARQDQGASEADAVAPEAAVGVGADRPPVGEVTFERLGITAANRLPYLAALEVACQSTPRFMFLLVLGGYGVGKTALLEATHNAALHKRVANRAERITAENWCNEYYYSLPSRTKTFRERYRRCDMLLMDDIHFLQGKIAAQEELLHTVKDILARQGRVVLSTATHPGDLQDVAPALRTVLGGAFRVELIMPPVAECELLARQLARSHGLRATDEVFGHLAQEHSGNILELNAAVVSLATYASLQGYREVDFAVAREALAATSRSRGRPPVLSDIQNVVLDVFSVSEAQLKGKSRCRSLCRARHVAMYLARQLTHESLSDIGRFFGGRTHSTVKYAIKQVAQHAESEQGTASLVERCRRRLRWR